MPPKRLVSLLFVSSCALACASTEAGAPSSPNDAGGRKDVGTPHREASLPPESGTATHPDGAPPRDAAAPASCADAGHEVPGAVCITEVHGRAVDENGAPFAKGQLVSACGTVQCNPGFTDDTGVFTIPVGFNIVPGDYSVQVHDRVDLTAFYYALPSGTKGPVVDMGDVRSLAMPATGPELAVDRAGVPAQSVTSGDVTLDVPGNIYVRLDIESNLAENTTPGKGRAFRALRIPDKFVSEFADPSLGVVAMYALEPFECSFEVAGVPDVPVNVRLGFVNSAHIPAGTAVDVLALGTYIYPDWIPPAAFTKVAKGHVSSDGARIDLDSGEGLPYLTWVAIRKTP